MRRYGRLLAVILFLGMLLAVFESSGMNDHLTIGFLRHKLLADGATGLLVFMLAFSLGNLIQIPGWVFLAAAVLTLGQITGGLATYAAACVSCVTTFLVIRLIGNNALRQIDNKVADRVLGHLDARPIASVFLLRVLFQTVPALNYTLAMSGIKFRNYLIGTVLGLPLPIALYCLFFDYLAKALRIH